MSKEKWSAIPEATLVEAFEDWNDSDAYVSGDHYRLKSIKKNAPWSRAIRKAFYNNEHFHRAAKHYEETGEAVVPPHIVHENVRITRYADRIVVEVARAFSRYSDTLGYNWEDTTHLSRWAAEMLYNAVKDQHPDHAVFQGPVAVTV